MLFRSHQVPQHVVGVPGACELVRPPGHGQAQGHGHLAAVGVLPLPPQDVPELVHGVSIHRIRHGAARQAVQPVVAVAEIHGVRGPVGAGAERPRHRGDVAIIVIFTNPSAQLGVETAPDRCRQSSFR